MGIAGVTEILDKLRELGAQVNQTGSRYICDPPVLDTDDDWLVYSKDRFGDVESLLAAENFSTQSQDYGGPRSRFTSWRKGDLNLIVTGDSEFAKKHRLATEICKHMNLLDKEDRIAIFQRVLYGVDDDWLCPQEEKL